MGEYEDRYPEAYGRTEEETPQPAAPSTAAAPPASAAASTRPLLRDRLGVTKAAERVRAWQHRPADRPASVETPPVIRNEESLAVAAAAPAPALAAATSFRAPAPIAMRRAGTFRGLGPRGYARSAERIREDICDRLTENPFIDASDMEVLVGESQVRLTGTVDSLIASHQAQAIAEEVAGVSHVHNQLQVRPRGDLIEPTPGAQVNTALGTGRPPQS